MIAACDDAVPSGEAAGRRGAVERATGGDAADRGEAAPWALGVGVPPIKGPAAAAPN